MYKLVTLDTKTNTWKTLYESQDWVSVETVQRDYEARGVSVHRVVVGVSK